MLRDGKNGSDRSDGTDEPRRENSAAFHKTLPQKVPSRLRPAHTSHKSHSSHLPVRSTPLPLDKNTCQSFPRPCYNRCMRFVSLRRPVGVFALIISVTLALVCGGLPTARADDDAERVQQLYDACQANELETLQKLLKAGVDPNARLEGAYLEKPFHLAIHRKYFDGVRAFLAAGARVKGPFPAGQATPLSAACTAGWMSEPPDRAMIDLLMKHGADPVSDPEALAAAAGADLKTMLFFISLGAKPTLYTLAAAVDRHNMETFEELLKRGIDPKARLPGNRTLFHAACSGVSMRSSEKKLLDRLAALGLDMNAQDAQGLSPAHAAVQTGQGGALQWLLEHGAEVSPLDDQGRTPLILAAQNEDLFSPNAVPVLAREKAKANLDHRDQSGRCALDYTLIRQNWFGMKALIEAGAQVPQPEKWLAEILQATERQTLPGTTLRGLLLALLPKIGDVKSFQTGGRSLLVWAVLLGDPALLQSFIDAGCPVNAADAEGRTPLIWARITGADALSGILLQAGAREDLKDASGLTAAEWQKRVQSRTVDAEAGLSDGSPFPALRPPDADLFTAIAAGRLEIVQRLLAAKPTLLDERRSGIAPVHLAAARGQLSMMKLFHQIQPAQLDAVTEEGHTVPEFALEAGYLDILTWLVQATPAGRRARMLDATARNALETFRTDVILALLEAGWQVPPDLLPGIVDLAVMDDGPALLKRLIPLGIARVVHSPEMDYGIEPFSSGKRGWGLLRKAASRSDTEILALLLEKVVAATPDLDWQPDLGAAVFAAAKDQNEAVLKMLIRGGHADVNARDIHGWTPLHQCVREILPEAARLLVAQGARSDIRNDDGKTATDFTGRASMEEWLGVGKAK